MCGKFTQLATWAEVHAFSQPLVERPKPDEIVTATPMRSALIMRRDTNGARELVSMRWGFADRKSATPLLRPKHMHARAETIDTLPTFRRAFAEARGILMVQTFNEGEELPSGKTKQWIVSPIDNLPIAIAVICEKWINGAEVLETFVQVTVPANALISCITDRMPAILPREVWPQWLGETDAPLQDVKTLLRTFDDDGNWTMMEQPSSKRPSRSKPKADRQDRLF